MNETLKTIHSLVTTHGNFTDRPVSPKDLETVLQASLRAATASSRQSYSMIAVEDRQMIRQLCGYNGTAGIVYCVDFNRLLDTADFLGEKFVVNGFMDFITGSTDTILAAQTGAVAARSLGLDSLFTNGIHRGDVNRVFELLGLPDKYCVPLIMLVLGYGENTKQPRGRLGGEGIVHRGQYSRITETRASEIVTLYDTKENMLGMSDYWESEGYEHYFGWFFNEWTHTDPKRAELFEKLLRERGFLA
jgi:FMN reductase [NAD(P)H]